MNDKNTFVVRFEDMPERQITADGFQVYDRGDLVFFTKSTENQYDLDNIAAFAAGKWISVDRV